ncbi:MAG: chorismate mutase [Lactimicrobium sp.]|jgi:monofunctional chorismate mutase|uniref:chorismate mutase n=1 Tax=Lactimicrobium sp. TaxID=2563780 RepID=UPI002F360065
MTENKLKDARSRIDAIDAQMADLFAQRFAAVRDVIDYKIENRLPILDSGREKEILEKNVSRISDDDIRPYFRRWYQELMELSKEYQKQIREEK